LPTEFHHLCPELVKNGAGLFGFCDDRPFNRLIDHENDHGYQDGYEGEGRGTAGIPRGQGRGLD
jgi:hypothetical protein